MAEVMAQTDELEAWLSSVKRELRRRTGRRDIEVSGGPYRGYDVRVSEAGDGHPIVDLYTPMRWDPHRVGEALDYAVSLLEDWEATRAEHQAEMRAVRPIFERLQALFPEMEMGYTVGYADTHQVIVERDPGTERFRATFDLWPAMREKDIQGVASRIRRAMDHLRRQGGTMMGTEYWVED